MLLSTDIDRSDLMWLSGLVTLDQVQVSNVWFIWRASSFHKWCRMDL